MLAGSSTAPSTISTDTSPALPITPQRSGRLRGLSYLRNISHNHLHPILNPNSPTEAIQPQYSPVPSRSTPAFEPDPATPHNSASRGIEHSRTHTRPLPFHVNLGEAQQDNQGLMTRAVSSNTSTASRTVSSATQTHSDPASQLLPTVDESLPGSGVDGGQRSTAAPTQIALPCIQLIPASEPHRTRPSLDFRRITRTLPSQSSIIRVGRYSERDSATDSAPNIPSEAPIGFKSKVVSRRHCEFSYSNSQWYIKDVKSSSGTFLNHIRLSQPGLESRLYPVNDGDIVQLGIDFKGGEEMIFRCVKIRIETNRGWQRGLNKFNKSTYKHLRSLAKGEKSADSDTISKHSTECTICLNSIAPCQALFVAPCSHTWHYKCIRTILEDPKYPQFLCPNCRAQADLDADVEEEILEDFESYSEEQTDGDNAENSGAALCPANEASKIRDLASVDSVSGLSFAFAQSSDTNHDNEYSSLDDAIASNRNETMVTTPLNIRRLSRRSRGSNLNPSASSFVPTPTPPLSIQGSSGAHNHKRNRTNDSVSDGEAGSSDLQTMDERLMQSLGTPQTATLEAFRREGPMTPRNNAGPFVLDGSGLCIGEEDAAGSERPASP